MIGNTFLIRKAHDYIDRVFSEHLLKTQEFLRFPSISSEGIGLKETASWLQEYLETLGGQIQLVGNPDAPILWAKFDLGQPKTLLVYSMYDVQSVADQVWSSPPFEANILDIPNIGPSVVARGACNSKGPLSAFLNALDTLKKTGGIPVNLILTIEGEEEIGSPTMLHFFKENKEQLRADAGFEPFWADYGTDVNHPILSLGSKGLLIVDLVCRGGDWGGPTKHAIHSSTGGWLASPAWRLLKAVSTMIAEDETVVIEGFYDETVPPNSEDEHLLLQLSKMFDENGILNSMGAKRFKYALHGADLFRKYLFSPTLNLGNWESTKSDVISPESKIQLVIRLVPEMAPEKTFQTIRRHLATHGYADIDIDIISYYPYSRTGLKDVVVQSLLETYRDFGVQPQIWPLSASSTPYFLFSDVLKIPYAWGGLGKAGGSHVADEYASVEGLKLFEKSMVSFLHRFADS